MGTIASAAVAVGGRPVVAVAGGMGVGVAVTVSTAVSVAFALRGDFPWKRVPAYIVAQFLGAALATLLLWALVGKQGSAGLTLPRPSGLRSTASISRSGGSPGDLDGSGIHSIRSGGPMSPTAALRKVAIV